MNLIFIGITVSDDLKKTLSANGFNYSVKKKIPTVQDSNAQVGLIAIKPTSLTTLKELKVVRNAYPLAWVAVIIPPDWLKDPKKVNALLRCADKNEIWIETIWERTLWFSIQSALNHQAAFADLSRLKEERESLKKQYTEMQQHTGLLVRQLERDVRLAANIQRSLLPQITPQIPGISLAVKYIPATGVGGDYYDLFEFGDKKRFGILVADAKTHGMAAALLSVLIKVKLEEMKDLYPDAKSFVNFLDQEIKRIEQKHLAPLSLFYCILDRSLLTLQFTVAGPFKPILWRLGETRLLCDSLEPPLGTNGDSKYSEHSVNLEPGDVIVLHTDGLEGPLGGNAFGKISQLLASNSSNVDLQDLQNEIMAVIDRHLENEKLSDDLTIIELAVNERALYLTHQTTKKLSQNRP